RAAARENIKKAQAVWKGVSHTERARAHPTDFSDRSGCALRLAAARARDYRARLIVLHMMPRPVVPFGSELIPPDSADLLEEVREQLDGLTVPGQEVLVERRLAEGDPAEAILHVTR